MNFEVTPSVYDAKIETRPYYYHFDVLKGIAIVLVVVGHIMLFSFKIDMSPTSECIYFNMPLFFYMAGFLAYKKADSGRKVMRRILNRGMVLLIPYVVFVVLYQIFTGSTGSDILQTLLEGGGRYGFLYDLFVFAVFS